MRRFYMKKLMPAACKNTPFSGGFKLAVAALLLSFTGTALAQCHISVTQSQLHFGSLPRAQLKGATDRGVSLGKHYFNVDVQCPQPRLFAIAYQGNSQSGESYSLDSDHARVELTPSAAQADGQPVILYLGARSAFPAGNNAEHARLPLHPLTRNMIYPGRRAVSQLSFQMTAEVWLAANALNRGERVHLNGIGTFDVMEYQ
ncbi:hypothetical protein YEEN111655_02250 [Yersinia entomophaga]